MLKYYFYIQMQKHNTLKQGTKTAFSSSSPQKKPQPQKLLLYDHPFDWIKILNQTTLTKLLILDLAKCQLNYNNIHQIANRSWPALRLLMLGSNKIDEKALEILLNTQLPNLISLYLDGNKKIGNKGFLRIFDKTRGQLQEVTVQNCGITAKGIRQVLKLDHNHNHLRILFLGQNYIGSSGVKYLTKIFYKHLEKLGLRTCEIGSQGLKHLIKGKWLKLTSLQLGLNFLTANGYAYLELGNWPNLKSISTNSPFSLYSEIDPINIFNIMTLQASKTKINKQITNPDLDTYIDNILNKRFEQK